MIDCQPAGLDVAVSWESSNGSTLNDSWAGHWVGDCLCGPRFDRSAQQAPSAIATRPLGRHRGGQLCGGNVGREAATRTRISIDLADPAADLGDRCDVRAISSARVPPLPRLRLDLYLGLRRWGYVTGLSCGPIMVFVLPRSPFAGRL